MGRNALTLRLRNRRSGFGARTASCCVPQPQDVSSRLPAALRAATGRRRIADGSGRSTTSATNTQSSGSVKLGRCVKLRNRMGGSSTPFGRVARSLASVGIGGEPHLRSRKPGIRLRDRREDLVEAFEQSLIGMIGASEDRGSDSNVVDPAWRGRPRDGRAFLTTPDVTTGASVKSSVVARTVAAVCVLTNGRSTRSRPRVAAAIA